MDDPIIRNKSMSEKLEDIAKRLCKKPKNENCFVTSFKTEQEKEFEERLAEEFSRLARVNSVSFNELRKSVGMKEVE